MFDLLVDDTRTTALEDCQTCLIIRLLHHKHLHWDITVMSVSLCQPDMPVHSLQFLFYSVCQVQ